MATPDRHTERAGREGERMSTYNKEWIPHYIYLEALRTSGVTNMFGASPYLAAATDLSSSEASNVLVSWMENYEALIEDGVITRGE